ncbi:MULTISPECIES: cupin domain-containing protein [unclassified Microcoleus]|uniref:cupin domain-containing protein n=1 Tax=unclassified Microcoleus TaxID=2642155 RepID=UPI0025CCCD6B|nr:MULTISPECIES: cupin domain-containing protein [unclassified Microcoleus]
MLVQKLNGCDEFIAGDGTQLRELLHPDKQAVELRYSLAHATLPPGETSALHSLTTSEVYYIISGVGEMHIDDEVQLVQVSDAVYIPPNAKQFIYNCGTEPLIFICIVDPAWRKEDETIFQ